MSKPYAYSETHKRIIDLEQARTLFFSQTGTRKRFIFRCGDPECRKVRNPLIIGVGYDKPLGTAHQSPNFRENHAYPHIDTCTWVNKNKKTAKKTESSSNPTSTWIGENELIFISETHDSNAAKQSKVNTPRNTNIGERPQTSSFIHIVASRYLKYTDYQRKSTNLTIENAEKGNFHSICIPIRGFHPFYQSKRIYFGKVDIVELNFVFLIRFSSYFASDGNVQNRNQRPEIKLLKSVLDTEDAAMKEKLHCLSKDPEPCYCFFYTIESPIKSDVNGKKVGRFEMNNLSHIAIIPVSTITSDS